jgi:murein DD-endopeptidase MepM/ murein hydrolase activator NlpD
MTNIRAKFLMLITLAAAAPAYAVDLAGSLAQGGMAWGQVPPGTELILDGEPVKVGPEGNFVFGFGRDALAKATLIVIERSGIRREHMLAVEKREFNIEHVDGLPPKTVTPPPEWRERRKVETGRVRKARAENTNDTHWLSGFLKPAEGRFSGFYGSQRILNGKPRSPHYGLDIAAPVGEPIFAPAAGTVRLAAPDFLLEGGIVIIDHGFGVTSTLFHMNSVDVAEGAYIEQGTKIGTIGAKGRASGPHVDWRVNWGNVRLDPLLLIENK